jgi:aspartate racemase
MAVGFLGIFKAGGAYLPLDPNYPSERLAFMLADSQAGVLLTQQQLLGVLPDHSAQVVCLDKDWEAIAQQSQENPFNQTTPENLAYIIYTSGSTGKPKGVMIPHRGLVNHNVAIAKQFNLQPSDRVLQFSSISFDIAVEELFPSWISGAALIVRPEEILSSIKDFLHFVAKEQVTLLDLPTAFWQVLVNELYRVKTPLPASLRLVVVGGEKASRSAYLTWLELVGDYPRWLNTYGPTETTVTATLYDPASHPESDQALSEIPIGRPIANVQVYILDQQLQPVPIGVPGELHIGGAGLARGYLNRPELTAEKFIPNPFVDTRTLTSEAEARLYKTGDLVRYLPDGNIEYIGRLDNQVKIRGFRIELGEIEAVLEQHPAVQQMVVLVREDEPGRKRLVAYVVPNQEHASTTSELRSFLKERLPDYMVPAVFVMLDELPMTPNGKVDRRALPVPNQANQETEETFVAPRTHVEEELASIWANVLKLERLGVHDSFFDLGGHSLLAMQVMSRLRQAFGVELPVRSLFEAPTVAELAEQIDTLLWATQQNLAAHSSTTEDDLEEIEL